MFLLASWDDRRLIEVLMTQLRALSIPVYLLPDRNVAHFLGKRMVNVGTAWTAELQRAPLTTTEQVCKRAFDLLIASVLLIMLAPLLLLVAALIKMETRGPALFMQRRSGFNGRTFRIYKFRTMSVLEDGPVIRQATRNDPRLTRCGRVLRRTNIDELPQLLNVIAGEMSLVGPRPHPLALNSEYENIIGNYAFRHHVKPGLTGWAQVNGLRGETQTVDLMTEACRTRPLVHQQLELLAGCKDFAAHFGSRITARRVLISRHQRERPQAPGQPNRAPSAWQEAQRLTLQTDGY